MNYFSDLSKSLAILAANTGKLDYLLAELRLAKSDRRTVFICGNGGSYANAIHWATDFTKAAGMRALTLGSNSALLTAVANDQSYQDSLARELGWLARPKDVLVVLSVSGMSANARRATQVASERGLIWFMLTKQEDKVEVPNIIRLPATDYGLVEDMHAAVGHWLTKELSL